METKELLGNPSVRRAAFALMAPALAVLNKKWGIDIDPETMIGVSTVLGIYIAQSGLNSAKAKGAEAAATVKTPADAVAVLNEAPKP